MRIRLTGMIFLAAALSACAPYRSEHRQLVLRDVPDLEVIEHSKPPENSAREEIRDAKYGLPVLARLKREAYTLTIQTPANSSYPMLFIGARTSAGEKLRIEGPHLATVHPDALSINEDHPYMFATRLADGAPLEFIVRDADGKQIGVEKLAYEIVVTGVIWGIDTV